MSEHPLDAPEITNTLFFVRRTPAEPTNDGSNGLLDGRVHVTDEISVGYRLYRHLPTSPLLLFFHGNGEIATDYEEIAPIYHVAGASLLVVDYRGYGWSTGVPRTTQMLPDAEKVLQAMPDILEKAGINAEVPLFVMGRSLGSAPAIYLAYKHPQRFHGLIIDSGYADAPSLFRRLGTMLPAEYEEDDTLPLYNGSKMQRISLPLLVIHGGQDAIIPVSEGRTLYESAATVEDDKELVVILSAGHNNLMSTAPNEYFGALRRFILRSS